MKKTILTKLIFLFTLLIFSLHPMLINAEYKPDAILGEHYRDAIPVHHPQYTKIDHNPGYAFNDNWTIPVFSLRTPWNRPLSCANSWYILHESATSLTDSGWTDGKSTVVWESLSTEHPASGDGYAVGDYQDYQLIINGVRQTPYLVKHGGRVVFVDGEYRLQGTWSYNTEPGGVYYPVVIYELGTIDPVTGILDYAPGEYYNPEIVRWVRIDMLEGGYYSPLVDGKVPIPPSNAFVNNQGEIDDTFTYNIPLGVVVDTIIDAHTITGAVTMGKLTRNTSGGALTVGEYKATVDTSGASHLLTGNILTGIGTGTLVWTITDYEDDVTVYTQTIKTEVSGETSVKIYFPGTTIPYDNRWMSTYQYADADRRDGLDVQGSSTIDGNYDLATFINGTEKQKNEVNKTTSTPVTNAREAQWSIADSGAAGIPATSQAFSKGTSTSISSMSAAERMYFDSTLPTVTTVTSTDNWATITTDATDDVSGIGGPGVHDVGDVYYKWVLSTDPIPTTPTDGSDWTSTSSHTPPSTPGEWDLYVYAKDNATNRSEAIKGHSLKIEEEVKEATIRLEKRVKDNKGNANDIFLITLKDGSTQLTTVALKKGDESGALKLDMGSATSKNIDVSEIIPMDYAKDFTVLVRDNAKGTTLGGPSTTVKVLPGDDITIIVENTFAPTGYFKGKDFVKNLFK